MEAPPMMIAGADPSLSHGARWPVADLSRDQRINDRIDKRMPVISRSLTSAERTRRRMSKAPDPPADHNGLAKYRG